MEPQENQNPFLKFTTLFVIFTVGVFLGQFILSLFTETEPETLLIQFRNAAFIGLGISFLITIVGVLSGKN